MFIKILFLCFLIFVNVRIIKATGSYYMNYGFADENFDNEWENDTVIAQLEAVADVQTSVKFILFTRTRLTRPIIIRSINERTPAMIQFTNNFDRNLETKIFVHGWKSNLLISAANSVIDAYHNNRNCNVIALDWSNLATTSYISAVGYSSGIGKYLASMINFLVQEQRTNLNKIHIIGHSMGAHIAGFAGLFITVPGKIERITGLDPAYPLFSSFTKNYRLDTDDANFVDVIHTSAGTLGYAEDMGHVDFYPNGGEATQPGCTGLTEYMGNICSHGRACDYFVESIQNPIAFLSVKCHSWDKFKLQRCDRTVEKMGDSTPKTTRGRFYLETNGRKPFSKNNTRLS